MIAVELFELHEPTYGGRTATYWLRYLGSPSNYHSESVVAFRAMGTPGVLFLAKRVQQCHPDGRLEGAVMKALERSHLHVAKILISKHVSNYYRSMTDRLDAFDVIARMGPDAIAAMPTMIRELNISTNTIGYAKYPSAALAAMADKKTNAIPDFIKLLHINSERMACVSADLLGSIGPKAKPAVPELLEQLPNYGSAYSNAVAVALLKIDGRRPSL